MSGRKIIAGLEEALYGPFPRRQWITSDGKTYRTFEDADKHQSKLLMDKHLKNIDAIIDRPSE